MRKTRIKDIFIIHDLFTPEELSVVQECLQVVTWSPDLKSPNFFVDIGREQADHSKILQDTTRILELKKDLIKENMEKDFSCTVGDEGIGTVVKYHVGWTLEYHADCWSGLSTYAGYPSRDISSIIYLTENYEGGNLVFPDLDIEIEPCAGSGIYFPGDEEHMHEVTEVLSGDRSTCTGFWHILDRK